jgi:ubiquinone/menaquinone biosynthesis C-methylase UbiE
MILHLGASSRYPGLERTTAGDHGMHDADRSQTSLQDGYSPGHSAGEHERLRLQGDLLEPATRRLFQAIGVRPGWRCLDVGCGPGATMQVMGDFVGPSGEVTGLDRDAKAGSDAVERLQATATSRYRFIEADMEGDDVIGAPPFDLTFARLSLLHVRNPVAVLRKMYGWTKPGGYVAAQDYYVRTMNLYPKVEAGSELIRVIQETSARAGVDLEFAFKLPVYFADAGIGAPDGTDTHVRMSASEPFVAMYIAFCRSLLPKAVALGVTTQARMEGVFGELEQAIADGRPSSALWPVTIGVWKRKPPG